MIDSNFFKNPTLITLAQICQVLDLELPPSHSKERSFTGVASLSEATPFDVSWYHNPGYRKELEQTQAGLCLVKKEAKDQVPKDCLALVTPYPYRAFGQLATFLYPPQPIKGDISLQSLIHPTAQIGKNCVIAPFAIIEEGAIVGEDCFIGPHCVIQKNVILGNNCYLESHINLSYSLIGNNVIIKSGAQIGQTGFGFAMDEKGHIDIPQLGRVLIGNKVHIGSNTTIDRGSFGDTRIGHGVRIDNLVQIAHNVDIGDHSVLVAQVGVAGSSKLGKFVILAGQVGVAGHLQIGDGVKVAAQSGIIKNLASQETVGGSPALPIRDWHKQTLLLKRLINQS